MCMQVGRQLCIVGSLLLPFHGIWEWNSVPGVRTSRLSPLICLTGLNFPGDQSFSGDSLLTFVPHPITEQNEFGNFL